MTLTAERLRELLHYNKATGDFTWRVCSNGYTRAGYIAGHMTKCGYWNIQIDRRKYCAHRVAWLYVYGEWPKVQIDHINGRRLDNRWCNLRLATQSENNQNQRAANSRNKCGFLGVSRHGPRWRANIGINGHKKHIGVFDTPELAHAAYLAAKARLHPFQTITPLSQWLSDSESKLNRAMKCTII